MERGVTSRLEWETLLQVGGLPDYVPQKPYDDPPYGFKGCGWASWDHWFGKHESEISNSTTESAPQDLEALGALAHLETKKEKERLRKQKQRDAKRQKLRDDSTTETTEPVEPIERTPHSRCRE